MSYDKTATYPVYESPTRVGTSLLLLAAGAAVGAIAGLVLAPASGRETRAYLNRRGRALAGDMAARGRQVWVEHGERVADAVREGYAAAATRLTRPVNGSDAVQ